MGDKNIFLQEKTEEITMTCPHCGVVFKTQAPTNQCVLSLECPYCHSLIEKNESGCCVYCSHGGAPSCRESCET